MSYIQTVLQKGVAKNTYAFPLNPVFALIREDSSAEKKSLVLYIFHQISGSDTFSLLKHILNDSRNMVLQSIKNRDGELIIRIHQRQFCTSGNHSLDLLFPDQAFYNRINLVFRLRIDYAKFQFICYHMVKENSLWGVSCYTALLFPCNTTMSIPGPFFPGFLISSCPFPPILPKLIFSTENNMLYHNTPPSAVRRLFSFAVVRQIFVLYLNIMCNYA